MTKILLKAIVITTIASSIYGFSCLAESALIITNPTSSTIASGVSSVLEITHNPKTVIKTTISETAPTRINFGGYQITEVIGDENKYKIITDGNGLNVFITPKVASGSVIPMTLIAGSNKVQDLLLIVSEEEKLPRSLIIASCLSKRGEASVGKSETELMLQAMIDDENPKDKYYATLLKRKLVLPSLPKLSIIQDKSWRFKGLTGASLIITNKGKVAANLQGKHISNLFKGTRLTVINNNLLGAGMSARAFVITEGEE